jgi:hypothetical protein
MGVKVGVEAEQVGVDPVERAVDLGAGGGDVERRQRRGQAAQREREADTSTDHKLPPVSRRRLRRVHPAIIRGLRLAELSSAARSAWR